MAASVTLEDRHLAIFPCRAKKPACRNGFYDAVSDPELIEVLFRAYPTARQIGVATGEYRGNDLDVLDIDLRKGGDAFFEQNRHRIPQTRTHQTPSGGLHLLFRHAPGLRGSEGRIAKGIDVRADGCYVVWWPAQFYPVTDAPVAEWPDWLLDLAMAAMHKRDRAIAKNEGHGPLGVWQTSQGDYKIPDALYRKMVALLPGVQGQDWRRVRGLLNTLVQKRPGDHRNKALNYVAYNLRELIRTGVVTRNAAEELLYMAADLNGHLQKRGKKQTEDTIASGLGPETPSGPSPQIFDGEENAP
jgi:hypothetical protein